MEQGYQAARECAVKILRSVWNTHGTLNGLRVLKVLGCVNSSLDFHRPAPRRQRVLDLLHEVFGKTGDGIQRPQRFGIRPGSRLGSPSRSKRFSRSSRSRPAPGREPRPGGDEPSGAVVPGLRAISV